MGDILEQISKTADDYLLASVIHVDGSAYRKAGAAMLFMKNNHVGTISAGCLEADLTIQADRMFDDDTLHSQIVVYDMRSEDDLGWGRGAGCNGNVHILLERVTQDVRQQLLKLYDVLRMGIDVVAVKLLTKIGFPIQTLYITRNKCMFGDSELNSDVLIKDAYALKQSQRKIYDESNLDVFFHCFSPRPRLFIFGAGPDVKPLSIIANQTGFSVHIWDWRPNRTLPSIFPDATLINDHSVEGVFQKTQFKPRDSIVIMTHDFQKDKDILQHVLNRNNAVGYVGILGPRKRTARLMGEQPIPKKLHSPVGLDIGAEGPEEIAISIVSELIKTKRMPMARK